MTALRISRLRARAGILALAMSAALAGCNGGDSGIGTVAAPASTTGNGSSGSGGSTGVSTGSAMLSWLPPDTNTDGSALTNLAGYYIHYGTDMAHLDQLIKIATVGLTNYVIDNLASGTYYFAMSSYSTAGVESALSAIVSKTI